MSTVAKKRGRKPDAINPRQHRFIAEYLLSLNAADAAQRAGFSAHSAAKTGFRLLRNPLIAKAIEQGRHKTAQKLELTREMVIAEVAAVGFTPIHLVSGIERMKVADKVQALRLLMANMGLLEPKQEESSSVQGLMRELADAIRNSPHE